MRWSNGGEMKTCTPCFGLHAANQKYSRLKRVQSVASVTVMDLNFGYLDSSLLTPLRFGASQKTLAGLNTQEGKRRTPRSKKTAEKPQSSTERHDYWPGGL